MLTYWIGSRKKWRFIEQNARFSGPVLRFLIFFLSLEFGLWILANLLVPRVQNIIGIKEWNTVNMFAENGHPSAPIYVELERRFWNSPLVDCSVAISLRFISPICMLISKEPQQKQISQDNPVSLVTEDYSLPHCQSWMTLAGQKSIFALNFSQLVIRCISKSQF